MLDSIRLEQYNKNHFTETALKYFRGQRWDVHKNMVGMELNINCWEWCENHGYENMEFEVDIITTKIDVLAEKAGEKHAFECKSCSHLHTDRLIKQIKKYRGHYKNVHVFICSDTSINLETLKAIKENKADIVRADITKEELINRVLMLVH